MYFFPRAAIIGSYSREAQLYFDACSVKPNAARCYLLDQSIFRPLKDWYFAKADFLYLFASHDSQAALVNLVTPGTYTLAVTGTVTFATDKGYTSNGNSGSFLSTGKAQNGFAKYTINDAHMGLWSLTNLQNGGARSYDMGTFPGTGDTSGYISRETVSAEAVYRPNTTASWGAIGVGWYPGHVLWVRTASNAWTAYKQGNSGDSGSDATGTLTSATMYILNCNNLGGGVNQIAMACQGSQLTAVQVAEHYRLTSAYLHAIGAN